MKYDQYPFGMLMPARQYNPNNYRYGFNGKENDNETKGTGNQQNYGMRIYDPRLGKFLSVDPISKLFVDLSPYQFASNTPIWAIDWDGLEARIYLDNTGGGHIFISVLDDQGVIHIYTYGQYGQGRSSKKSFLWGEGALVHLVGDAANKYLHDEFEHMDMTVFEVSKEKVNKEEVMKYYENLMNGKPQAEHTDETAVKYAFEGSNTKSNAVKYSHYTIVAPNGENRKDCGTAANEGLKAGGCKMLDFSTNWWPSKVTNKLEKDKLPIVTEDARNGAKPECNEGGQVIVTPNPNEGAVSF